MDFPAASVARFAHRISGLNFVDAETNCIANFCPVTTIEKTILYVSGSSNFSHRLFRAEKVGMRGSLNGSSSPREPLTRPASLRSAGRPLPARATQERGEVTRNASRLVV
jgi:hypothetical protein